MVGLILGIVALVVGSLALGLGIGNRVEIIMLRHYVSDLQTAAAMDRVKT